LAGDSTTAPATNTTKLNPDGATLPLPGCADPPYAPKGVDAPPCSPKALDDEFTSTFGIADTNDPLWVAQGQTITASLTDGMATLTSASGDTGTNKIHCIMQAAPTTPYTFIELQYMHMPISGAGFDGVAFFESGTGKFVSMQVLQSNSDVMRL